MLLVPVHLQQSLTLVRHNGGFHKGCLLCGTSARARSDRVTSSCTTSTTLESTECVRNTRTFGGRHVCENQPLAATLMLALGIPLSQAGWNKCNLNLNSTPSKGAHLAGASVQKMLATSLTRCFCTTL